LRRPSATAAFGRDDSAAIVDAARDGDAAAPPADDHIAILLGQRADEVTRRAERDRDREAGAVGSALPAVVAVPTVAVAPIPTIIAVATVPTTAAIAAVAVGRVRPDAEPLLDIGRKLLRKAQRLARAERPARLLGGSVSGAEAQQH